MVVLKSLGNNNNFGPHCLTCMGSFEFNTFGHSKISSKLLSLSITKQNQLIPRGSTQYCYSFHVLPASQNYWALAEEAIIKSADIHHIILWGCPYSNFSMNKLPSQAFCDNFKRYSSVCSEMFVVWGLGEGTRKYPIGTGKRFGKTGVQFVLMETHYNDVMTPFHDNSGIKLFYTTTPQKQSVGVLVLGTVFI